MGTRVQFEINFKEYLAYFCRQTASLSNFNPLLPGVSDFFKISHQLSHAVGGMIKINCSICTKVSRFKIVFSLSSLCHACLFLPFNESSVDDDGDDSDEGNDDEEKDNDEDDVDGHNNDNNNI